MFKPPFTIPSKNAKKFARKRATFSGKIFEKKSKIVFYINYTEKFVHKYNKVK